jgi:hypothetical protein
MSYDKVTKFVRADSGSSGRATAVLLSNPDAFKSVLLVKVGFHNYMEYLHNNEYCHKDRDKSNPGKPSYLMECTDTGNGSKEHNS